MFAHLYKLRSSCTMSVKMFVSKALGESIIRFDLTIYGSASPCELNTINSILNGIATHLVYGTQHHGKTSDHTADHIQMLDVRRQFIFDVILKTLFSDQFNTANVKPRCLRHTSRRYRELTPTSGKELAPLSPLSTVLKCIGHFRILE